jgi:cytochrome c
LTPVNIRTPFRVLNPQQLRIDGANPGVTQNGSSENLMKMHCRLKPAVTGFLIASLALCLSGSAGAAVDEEAAKALARQNNCFKCHGVDKQKDGPAWREVAAKYKGKPDAEERLLKHLTTGEKAKFPDGHEEDHKIIKAGDPKETRNLVQWILSL